MSTPPLDHFGELAVQSLLGSRRDVSTRRDLDISSDERMAVV